MSDIVKLFEQRRWKRDVESFARMRALYDTFSDNGKKYVIKRLIELQNHWPHHKLGDMPHDHEH